MSLQDFKYFLIEEDGRSLYRQGNIVNTTGVHKPTEQSPDGVSEITIGWERDLLKQFGLTRNFALPLGFITDAAFILRDQRIRTNIERKIFLLIQQLHLEYGPDSYKWIYRYLYKGQLDFSTIKSDDDKVTINIVEGGLGKKYKASEATTFTIPFDADAIYVFDDGIFLTETHKWLIYAQSVSPKSTSIGAAFLNSEGTAFGVSSFTQIPNEVYDDPPANSLNYLFSSAAAIPGAHLKGSFVFTNFPEIFQIRLISNLGNSIDITPIILVAPPGPVTFDVEFDMQEGEIFYIALFGNPVPGQLDFSETEMSLTYKSRYKATSIKGYNPEIFFKKLVSKYTGSENNAVSNLLAANKNLVLTCGDAIRGIKTATIKTSQADFNEDYFISCFGGLSIDNGKIRIEDRATFFDMTNPIPLGTIRNFEWSEAADLLGNVYKIGSLKPEIEDVNGKFDPNGSTNYLTPIESVVKDIDLVGPYKKGPYEIEQIRLNLEGKTTTDDSSDNQCFVMDAVPGAIVTTTAKFLALNSVFKMPSSVSVKAGQILKIRGSVSNDQDVNVLFFATILGETVVYTDGTFVDEGPVEVTISFPWTLDRTPVVTVDPDVTASPETIFNVRLTPKNFFFKLQRWIHSQMDGFEADNIRFGSGDKNTKFSAIVDGKLIDEDRDEPINSLGPKMWLPYYFDFETLIPVYYEGKTIVELLEENPNRCFEFTLEDGTILKGFIVKCGFAPTTLAAQQFRLLATPDTDMTLLIH